MSFRSNWLSLQIKTWFSYLLIYLFIYFCSSHQLRYCKYPGSRQQTANSKHPAACFLALISSPIIEGLHAKPSRQGHKQAYSRRAHNSQGPAGCWGHIYQEYKHHTMKGRGRPQTYAGSGSVEDRAHCPIITFGAAAPPSHKANGYSQKISQSKI